MEDYIQKLEWLKEWIALKIDTDISNNRSYEIFKETGVFILPSRVAFISFKDFCIKKKKLTSTTTLKQYSYE